MGWATKFGRARGFLYNFALSDNAFPSQGFSMSDQSGVNRGRRSLVIASACAGGAATVATAVPFAASMLPSERAEALGAPVEVDISQLNPGEKMTVEWRGQPVWIDDFVNGSLKRHAGRVAKEPDQRVIDIAGIAGSFLIATSVWTPAEDLVPEDVIALY